MAESFNEFTKNFINHAIEKKPVLEIGFAYGNVVAESLSKKISITANDLREEHLKILDSTIKREGQGNNFGAVGEKSK